MRPAALLVVALLAVAPGCKGEPAAVEPPNDATHVSGTLTAVEDARPVDGGVTLRVRSVAGKDEVVYVNSIFTGQPPTTEVLALQQKLDELKVGTRFTATGTRDDDGRLIAERIEILGD